MRLIDCEISASLRLVVVKGPLHFEATSKLGDRHRIVSSVRSMSMGGSRVMMEEDKGIEIGMMRSLAGWWMRRFLEDLATMFAMTDPARLVASFVINPQTVLANPLPISHRILGSATRRVHVRVLHLGRPWCRRTLKAGGGNRRSRSCRWTPGAPLNVVVLRWW